MKKLLIIANAKVQTLEATVAAKDKIIKDLRDKANSLEQNNRKWSIRINDLPLPHGDDTHTNNNMIFTVYKKVLLPIFQGALDKGLLSDIPKYDSVLETTHILPASDCNPPKPILAWFYSRNIPAIVFRLKKEYSPMKTITATTSRKGDTTKKVFCYSPYKDLTKDTYSYNLVQALQKDPRTGPVWTINGNIRFRLDGDTTVKKVSTVYDSVESILGK